MTFRPFFLTALLLGTGVAHAQTDSFTLPADLTKSPFNCKVNGTAYDCPAISLSKDTTLTLTAPVTLNVSGGLDADKVLTTVNNGNKFTVTVSGPADFRKDFNGTMDLTVAGPLNFAKDAHFTGNITTAGNLTVAKDSWIAGNVVVSGNLDMGKDSYITGTCTVTGTTNYTCTGTTPPPTTTVHHVRLDHDGSGLTCSPEIVTVQACSAPDSGGYCSPATGGVSGNLIAAYSGGTVSIPFKIAPGATSNSVSVGVTTAGNTTLSADTPFAFTCRNTVAGTSSCVIDLTDDGGFVVSNLTNHYSDVDQNFKISAVRKGVSSQACVPAFKNVLKDVKFDCVFNSPHLGSVMPTVNGSNVKCGGTNSPVSLQFDNNGEATATFKYGDVGKLTLTATTGSVTGASPPFIVVPAKFSLQPNTLATGAPYVAGSAFHLVVTAQNNNGVTTPSYDKDDTATLSFKRCQPEISEGVDGVLNAPAMTFNAGISNLDLYWSEVGLIDLEARDIDYQGQTALPVFGTSNSTGTTCSVISGTKLGAVGPFRPHHLTTTITRSTFTYSGQPMPVTVTARNEQGVTTKNYISIMSGDPGKAYAQKVKLSAVYQADGQSIPTSVGTLSIQEVDATAFAKSNGGQANVQPAFTFDKPLTAPVKMALRAKDVNDVTSEGVTEQEGKTEIRSGRLRLSNVFGSASQPAKMPARAEYWTGQSWLLNSADTGADATNVPKLSIALTPLGTDTKVSGGITLVDGQGIIELSVPTKPVNYVDVAINLGDATSTVDVSCLADHPATTSAKEPWLRSQYGNCGNSADPSARASFGIYKPETKRTIHIQERFN